MQFTIPGNGANTSPVINMNADSDNFKVSVMIIPTTDFNGTTTVQYSPDNINWFDHEDLKALAGNKKITGNFFFPVPFARVQTATGTLGSVTVHLFGSVIR